MASLFVVLDLVGAGRVVGAFNSSAHARAIIGEFGHYYKVIETPAWLVLGESLHVLLSSSGILQPVAVTGLGLIARAWAARSPYHRVEFCLRNKINPHVLEWTVSKAQREHVASLMDGHGKK
ncbi:MAG: hypothetical protein HY698_15350 [Deltaproteobacteria bacterium]|nr:hypothetical protein [Deltaproteobacteria bacterium]